MITNTEYFREQARNFEKYGYYTDAPFMSKDWYDFWKREQDRCLNGLTVGDTTITGYHYHYLNYFPIMKVPDELVMGNNSVTRGTVEDRDADFPAFWDGDYEWFWVFEIAKNGILDEDGNEDWTAFEKLGLKTQVYTLKGGKHLVALKARGRGFSYKVASMLVRNYFHKRGSKNYALAHEVPYLTGQDGLLTRTWDGISFVDTYTGWTQPRTKDGGMKKRCGRWEKKGGVWVEKGKKNDIEGVTLKDNPYKASGKRGELVVYEEAGLFPGLKTAWDINLPSMQQDNITFGTQLAFGCVCAGTKVWNSRGDLVNIEDLQKEEGILGYDGKNVSREKIEWLKPPAYKPCYRITTNSGRVLECSKDHPILWTNYNHGFRPRTSDGKRPKYKKASFVEVQNIKEGDQLAVAREVNVFGDKKMWEPRLIGWLIGDGSYGYDKTPRLSNCEKEINNYVYNNFDAVFERGYTTKDGKEYKETRIKGICSKLRELGIYGQVKLEKRLPISVHSYDYESLTELIGGLFDSDGYIRESQKEGIRVNICFSGLELIYDLQLLLQKFGIHGTVVRVKKSDTNPIDKNDHFRLTVSDKTSVYNFYKHIILWPEAKRRRINKIPYYYGNRKTEHSPSPYVENLKFERCVKKEYIGEKRIYNLTAGGSNTYLANGIVTHNTGGATGKSFEDLNELFYNPEVNNVLPFYNNFEEGLQNEKTGFFFPVLWNKAGCMDKDGNSDEEKSMEEEDEMRAGYKSAGNPRDYELYIAKNPTKPSEASLEVSTNMFPTHALATQKANIKSKGLDKIGTPANLVKEEGKVKMKLSPGSKPYYGFPPRAGEDKRGCPVIYEAPYKDKEGKVPSGLYVVVHDPYAHDNPEGESLGAAYVIKNPNTLSQPDDIIVASYVGRPESTDDYNHNLFKLAEFYNAKIGFENDRGDVVGYAKRFKKLNYLCEEPDMLSSSETKRKGFSRKYGMSMNNERRKMDGEQYLADWLNTERGMYEDGTHATNVEMIRDPGFIEELIQYRRDKGNFDRVSAMMVGMFFLKDMSVNKVEKEEIPHSDFFDRVYSRNSKVSV